MPADHHHSSGPLPELPRRLIEQAAMMLRAAGDPERLTLLSVLVEGERCVSELVGEDAMSTVSQRLKVLRNAGLVSRRREGKHIYYALADEHVETLVRNALEHGSEPL